jgi:hypothetical protein
MSIGVVTIEGVVGVPLWLQRDQVALVLLLGSTAVAFVTRLIGVRVVTIRGRHGFREADVVEWCPSLERHMAAPLSMVHLHSEHRAAIGTNEEKLGHCSGGRPLM